MVRNTSFSVNRMSLAVSSPQSVTAIACRQRIPASMPHQAPVITPFKAPFIAYQTLVLELYPACRVVQRYQAQLVRRERCCGGEYAVAQGIYQDHRLLRQIQPDCIVWQGIWCIYLWPYE